MVLLLMKKRTLFSKIQAVRAHEVKLVSWASQLSLQALLRPGRRRHIMTKSSNNQNKPRKIINLNF
jgi:hypothetical protein